MDDLLVRIAAPAVTLAWLLVFWRLKQNERKRRESMPIVWPLPSRWNRLKARDFNGPPKSVPTGSPDALGLESADATLSRLGVRLTGEQEYQIGEIVYELDRTDGHPRSVPFVVRGIDEGIYSIQELDGHRWRLVTAQDIGDVNGLKDHFDRQDWSNP